MLAGLTEHLDEQLGGGVDDQRLIAEAIRRKHEADHLRNLLHVLQAGDLVDLGEDVQGTYGGGLLSRIAETRSSACAGVAPVNGSLTVLSSFSSMQKAHVTGL